MMKINISRVLSHLIAGVMVFSLVSCASDENQDSEKIVLENVTKAKNVILLIGDGMGPNQIKVGEIYKGETLTMQQFPYSTMVETESLDGITDSAAAATAMATGQRTSNGYVSMEKNWFTGENEELATIVDIATTMGKRTGILSTHLS